MGLTHIDRSNTDLIEQLEYVKQKDNFDWKPVGLWYASKNAWQTFLQEEMGHVPEEIVQYPKYKMKLHYTNLNHPDKNKVLQIKTTKDFDKFMFHYGGKLKIAEGFVLREFVTINWHQVEQSFGGIEIIPFLNRRACPFAQLSQSVQDKYIKHFGAGIIALWYVTFDVPSGCVWNPEAVKYFGFVKKDVSIQEN